MVQSVFALWCDWKRLISTMQKQCHQLKFATGESLRKTLIFSKTQGPVSLLNIHICYHFTGSGHNAHVIKQTKMFSLCTGRYCFLKSQRADLCRKTKACLFLALTLAQNNLHALPQQLAPGICNLGSAAGRSGSAAVTRWYARDLNARRPHLLTMDTWQWSETLCKDWNRSKHY